MKKAKKVVVWITTCIVITGIALLSYIPFSVMSPMLDQHVNFTKIWNAEEFDLNVKHFFLNTEDGMDISTYEVAVEKPKVAIICLSGIHNPSVTAFYGHAKLFKEQNYASFLIDMRAHGESSGDQICLGFKEHLDVKAVVTYIKKKDLYKDVPIVVMGLSMGGASAINSMGQISDLDGLISLSAYSSCEEVYNENMRKSSPAFMATISTPFVYLMTFLKYGADAFMKPKNEIKKLGKRPALLMHSTTDSQVPFTNFERIIENAPSHIETYTKKGDFHFILEDFTKPIEDTEYSKRLIGFINKNFVEKNKL